MSALPAAPLCCAAGVHAKRLIFRLTDRATRRHVHEEVAPTLRGEVAVVSSCITPCTARLKCETREKREDGHAAHKKRRTC